MTKAREALVGNSKADICVIGAGLTGLSAALHLAQLGRRVIVLEARRIAYGASGRNGGQLNSGQSLDQDVLERRIGVSDAKKLWLLAEEAKHLVKTLIARHKIDCHLRPGVARVGFKSRDTTKLYKYAELLREKYDYEQIETVDANAMRDLSPASVYHGGMVDWGAAHLHPLKFVVGLASVAEAAEAKIYELTTANSINASRPLEVITDNGKVLADFVILACNGYLGQLNQQVAKRVYPIHNYIIATAPLKDEAKQILTQDIAVFDTQFVVNYFRLSHDNRLLFGGGESSSDQQNPTIESLVRRPMKRIFPHLKRVIIDYAWGGKLAITRSRFPYFAQLAPNVFTASGYSGHGLGTATHAGMLMARAIAGDSASFDTMARFAPKPLPGGTNLSTPLLRLALCWYALRDRLGF
ncbi:MAG: FAD-binding oxidoreductase [Aestuariivita sp.]|nr:FAD-binding oxidoreductase [Aestuariivita sp.]